MAERAAADARRVALGAQQLSASRVPASGGTRSHVLKAPECASRVTGSHVLGSPKSATGAPQPPAPAPPESAGSPERRGDLRFWREIAIVLSFYAVYTLIRNQFGSELGLSAKQAAIENARSVIALERALHLFVENGIQRAFIDWDLFIRFWNVFYGLGHFAVTIGVMALLYVRCPERYGRWRTNLACTTGLALTGFSLYPLMPPRLLNDCGRFGACDQGYTFVDTLKDPGGLWSFDSSAMAEISNQYAAMPSLHVAWAFWCALAAAPVMRRRWTRLAVRAYPWLTLFAVIVTANHYWIDAVGALAVLGVGCLAGAGLCRVLPEWLAPRAAESAAAPTAGVMRRLSQRAAATGGGHRSGGHRERGR